MACCKTQIPEGLQFIAIHRKFIASKRAEEPQRRRCFFYLSRKCRRAAFHFNNKEYKEKRRKGTPPPQQPRHTPNNSLQYIDNWGQPFTEELLECVCPSKTPHATLI
uniref:Uncharacterized protein n=1 Tax=Oryza brachyantha TaxID=4533 RepID=J3MKJ1_ORYBR